MSARLPVAVVGAGRDALAAAEAAAADPDVALAAVVDPAPEGRERAAERGFPVSAEIAEAPSAVRAAIIAGSPAARVTLAEEAAARGWALLVDRPLARTLRDARRIVAAAEAAGVPLLVGHHRRHHACVAAAREALRTGLLGRPVSIDGVWLQRRPADERNYAWRVASGDGPVLSHLVHDLDLMRCLMGEIAQVSALAARGARHAPAEDSVAVALRFENGAVGTALLSDAALAPWGWEAATGETDDFARSGEDCLRLTGDEGALSLPSLAYWRHGGAGAADWGSPLSRLPLPCPPTDAVAAQIAHFVKVAAGEVDPMVTGPDALRSLAAALAVEESARTGRPVSPDPEREDAWEPTADAIQRDFQGRGADG